MSNTDKKKYVVYVHISPSEKYYVGLTSLKPNFRWGRNGHGYKSQYFSRAIKKYGWDNFSHIIVAEDLSKEEACNLEKMLIDALQTNNPKYGYNITDGGEGIDGFHHTEEAKEKIAKASSHPIVQYDLNGNYIKSWDSAQAAAKELNIDGSAILKCCRGKYHSSKGFVWRYKDEPFEKYIRKKYQQPLQRKQVKQFSSDGKLIKIWESISKASIELDINQTTIISCCKGKEKYKTAGGYVWRYIQDDFDKYNTTPETKHRGILQFDKNGEFINYYYSIKDAENSTNISRSNIIGCCKRNHKSAGGYIWRYETELIDGSNTKVMFYELLQQL